MTDYKVNFKELKSRVGIDDIAYALGYKLDRKAGVGRYIELVLGEGRDKRDTIIISNPNNKAAQTFFRRDGSKGDVLTLIRENLNAFYVSGKDDWQKIAKVMARFANLPEPAYKDDREYVRQAAKESKVFEATRYEVKQLDKEHLPYLFTKRGLSEETVKTFSPFISLIRDKRNEKFDGYNVGFPYTNGKTDNVQGYEIRGYSGYKAKAAGTDSTSSAWVADLSGGMPSKVFFCESAFDAMAFWQVNRAKIGKDAVLVSLGGTFSDSQVKGVMQRFPQARAYDCFDNDLAGRIYGLRLMALLENIPLKIDKKDGRLRIEAKGNTFELNPDRSLFAQVGGQLSIRYKMGRWLPPKAFKDWNDCLLDKPMEIVPTLNKNDRDRNLTERRSNTLKL